MNNIDSIALNDPKIGGKNIVINNRAARAPVIPAAIDVVAIIPAEVILKLESIFFQRFNIFL